MRDEPDNPMSLVLKGWHLLYTVTNKQEAIKGYELALKSIELGPDISETHVRAYKRYSCSLFADEFDA